MSKEPTENDVNLYNRVRADYRRIEDYTKDELDATIKVLGYKHPDAYEILNFVDAYFERRKRREIEEMELIRGAAMDDIASFGQ